MLKQPAVADDQGFVTFYRSQSKRVVASGLNLRKAAPPRLSRSWEFLVTSRQNRQKHHHYHRNIRHPSFPWSSRICFQCRRVFAQRQIWGRFALANNLVSLREFVSWQRRNLSQLLTLYLLAWVSDELLE